MKDDLVYLLKNWIEWDRKSLFFFAVRIPALVFQPIVTAYIPKAIIDCIDNGFDVGKLITVIALLSLLLTFTIWLDPFMKELIRGSARIIRMRYAVAAFKKNLYADYASIESLDGREMQKRAEEFYNARFSSGADFMETLNGLAVALIGVIASAVLLYKINVLMILLILLTCVGEFFLLKALNKKQRSLKGDIAKLSAKFDYYYKLSKDTASAKDIELYGFGDYFISASAKLVCAIEKAMARYTNRSAAVSGTRAILNLIRQLIAYAYLIYLVAKKGFGVSDFVFYFGIITGFSNWLIKLVVSYSDLERCLDDCGAYRAYLEKEEKREERETVEAEIVDSIEFRNVGFTYPGNESSTVKGMSFRVKKGENIAIVGENGAGKTTVVKLLCGLYAPSSGEIWINGKNSRDFSRESYFSLFSPVFQDFYFLPMTVAQNVASSSVYDREKLYRALEKAGIAEKISSLEQKENSLMRKEVYRNAVDFSGGEKQKLLLAKAVYKDAPVFILDEPTAALDPISENELYLKYHALTKDKISFFISHRLSSTRFCDRIFFIKDGVISETGTHEELIKLHGDYYSMYQLQSYYYKEGAVHI